MSDELALLSASELLRHYRNKTASPVEATKAALDRIDKFDGALNAFRFVAREEAMGSAHGTEAKSIIIGPPALKMATIKSSGDLPSCRQQIPALSCSLGGLKTVEGLAAGSCALDGTDECRVWP